MTTVISVPDDRRSGPGLDYRRFEPGQVGDLALMLGRCSRQTLLGRFHGVSDGAFWADRLARHADHVTVGAWDGGACVGTATLVPDGRRADLGVLVEDAWQRRGVGRALLIRLVCAARDAGIDEMQADIQGESAWILRALARIGTVDYSLACGVYTVRVALG